MRLAKRAKSLKVDIPIVYLALKDRETPVLAKVFAGITIVYALSPIDLIPDFVPFLGYLDDIIILPALIVLTLKFIPKELIEKHREQAEGLWKNGKPKKWYYAIPIIFLWLLALMWLLRLFLGK